MASPKVAFDTVRQKRELILRQTRWVLRETRWVRVYTHTHTNNRLKGTHWVRSPELSEPRKTHWARCLKPYSPKPYSARSRNSSGRTRSISTKEESELHAQNRSWQMLSRGPVGDRIARSCRHTGPDLTIKTEVMKDRIAKLLLSQYVLGFWGPFKPWLHALKSSENSHRIAKQFLRHHLEDRNLLK